VHFISGTLVNIPLALPGCLLALLVDFAVYQRVALRVEVRRYLAMVWLLALGVIIAFTFTPGRGAFDVPLELSCKLTPVLPLGLSSYGDLSERTLNVLLFIPYGAFSALLPRRLARPAFLLGLCLPFGIEAWQFVLVPLGRTCSAVDVVDNETGLVLGGVIGYVLCSARGLFRRY
jgi:glycopeptide antibiotics resistance protein